MARASDNAVSLESLAEGLGMDPQAFRSRVSALGYQDALTSDGRVPTSRVEEVVEGVRLNRKANTGGYDDFMRSLGVKPLHAEPPRPKARPPAPRPVAVPPPRPTAAVPPVRPLVGVPPPGARPLPPGATPTPPAPGGPATAMPAPPAPPAPPPPPVPLVNEEAERLRVQLDELSRELDRARARAALAEEQVRTAQDQALAAGHELDRARSLLADRDARLGHLGAQLTQLQARKEAEAAAPPSLVELLVERGLVGEDEGAMALRALLDSRRLAPLGALLKAPDADAARAVLRSRLVLHCGQRDCALPPGAAPVLVSRERCEVCGGSDSARALRRLSEALMLHGLRRVTIVGGSPAYHKVLRDGLDSRLDLTLIPGDARRTRAQAEADLERAQLLIVWGGTVLDHSVSDLYRGGPAWVVRVAHRGLGRMLDMVRQAIESGGSGDT